jgi:hypothetical protein
MSTSNKNTGCIVGVVVGFLVAAGLLFYGIILILGSSSAEYGDTGWLTQGMILVAVSLVLVGAGVFALLKMRPLPKQEIVQRIDLTGDVGVAKLTCKNCGGDLGKSDVAVKEGAIFVNCPYCGSTYQLVEEPKW